ncbi:MAG: dihydroorotase family protein [Candidatus Thorarchaeota archaeon]
MRVDTVVKNCRIVSSNEVVSAGLGIDDGKVVVVASDSKLPEADRVIDCKGNFVLPGAIDPHVHFGSYFPFNQDCRTETEAAALGGITSVMHHLIDKGSYSKIFDDHKRMAEENSLIDFAFHFAVMSETHLAELDDYVRDGTTSFKFFMAYRGEEGEQIGITAADDGLLYEGFRKIGKIGYPGLPLIHAENVEIAYRLKAKLIEDGRRDLAAWSEARPNFCEEENVVRAASIARFVGSPLYVVHVSTGESVEAIHRLKRSMPIFAEATPHHLTLTNDMDLGVLGKVAPPLRGKKSIETLWWGVGNGTIDCIGSDHAPITRENKGEDIWNAPPGFPGMGLILPIMITEGVKKGRINLEKVVEVCSYNTAKVFGLYPRKGDLKVGFDADLAVIDLDKSIRFKPEILPSVGDFSTYEGMDLFGWPTFTMVRGNIIVEDGELVGKSGIGQYIHREPEGN